MYTLSLFDIDVYLNLYRVKIDLIKSLYKFLLSSNSIL